MMTRAAEVAKEIREVLKQQYPTVKFTVHSSVFAGGDAVDISYKDGPPQKEVENLLSKYREGYFDGMTDSYVDFSNRNPAKTVKYLQIQRTYTPIIQMETRLKLIMKYGRDLTPDWDDNNRLPHTINGEWYMSMAIERELEDKNLTPKKTKEMER
jgi:hypothetical protein